MTEPTYIYRKGEGWVVSILPDLLRGFPYEFADLRTNKSEEGVWSLDIWLVDLPGYGYRDWVNHVNGGVFKSPEDCLKYFTENYNDEYHRDLCRRGMRQRLTQRDLSDGMWFPYGK